MDRPDICKKFLHPKMKILDCGGWQGNNFTTITFHIQF